MSARRKLIEGALAATRAKARTEQRNAAEYFLPFPARQPFLSQGDRAAVIRAPKNLRPSVRSTLHGLNTEMDKAASISDYDEMIRLFDRKIRIKEAF